MTGVGSVLNCAQPKPGDTIAVLGCGGVGLSVIQGARLAGAGRIIALDIRSESLARAARFGATDTILVDPTDGDHVGMIEAVKALTDGRGADAAFEATGVAALAFVPLRLVRNGGTAVQVSGAHGSVEVHMPHFWWDKRYITPLYGGCDPQRDFPRLMAWAISGEINLPAMISQTYALDDLGAALDDMLAGRIIKGVVVFPGGPDHVSNF
jgi:S-(hydroxymethyl)glutathione dehydrogenase/alcohol dehydrogenase